MEDEIKVDGAQNNIETPETEENQAEPKQTLINSATAEDDEPETTEGVEENPEEKSEGAPEDYGDFEMGEGVEIVPELMDKAKGLFKELNLTKEQAQKLVGVQTEAVQTMVKTLQDNWTKQVSEWETETIKELGADYKKELACAAKVRDRFFDDDLKKLVDESGLGNNPALVRAMIKIGKTISEDVPPNGRPGSGNKKDFLDDLYPSMKEFK
jgi:hypothetical protein